MDIYDAENYREFLKFSLKRRDLHGRRFKTADLAHALRCHHSYISQVLRAKADFSQEQAVACAEFFGWETATSDYFVDLVSRDRAGTSAAKSYFEKRLKAHKEKYLNIDNKLMFRDVLTDEQKMTYFESWIYQAVHLLCQLKNKPTLSMLAQSLSLQEQDVIPIVHKLIGFGLIEQEASHFTSVHDLLHLGTNSQLSNRFHSNWRLKTLHYLSAPGSQSIRTHYSSLVSISLADANKIRALISQHVKAISDVVLPSSAEKAFVFCTDFFEL